MQGERERGARGGTRVNGGRDKGRGMEYGARGGRDKERDKGREGQGERGIRRGARGGTGEGQGKGQGNGVRVTIGKGGPDSQNQTKNCTEYIFRVSCELINQ